MASRISLTHAGLLGQDHRVGVVFDRIQPAALLGDRRGFLHAVVERDAARGHVGPDLDQSWPNSPLLMITLIRANLTRPPCFRTGGTLPSGIGSSVFSAQVASSVIVAPFSITMKPNAASSMRVLLVFAPAAPGIAAFGVFSLLIRRADDHARLVVVHQVQRQVQASGCRCRSGDRRPARTR